MLDGQGDGVAFASAAQVEIAVAPGVQLRASAQGLTGAKMVGPFACMMHEGDASLVTTLQTTQVVQERGHIG